MKPAKTAGFTMDETDHLTHIDPRFRQDIKETAEMEDQLVAAGSLEALS